MVWPDNHACVHHSLPTVNHAAVTRQHKVCLFLNIFIDGPAVYISHADLLESFFRYTDCGIHRISVVLRDGGIIF